MDGNEKTGGTMRTRGAGAGPGGPSRVKQSFSHGRSKSVVVETKKKRVLKPRDDAAKPAAAKPAPAAAPAAAKPAAPAPAAAKPATPAPAAAKPATPAPAAAKPATPAPAAAKPDTTPPAAAKPDTTAPAAAKPDTPAPAAAKPTAPAPAAAKPAAPAPVAAKPATAASPAARSAPAPRASAPSRSAAAPRASAPASAPEAADRGARAGTGHAAGGAATRAARGDAATKAGAAGARPKRGAVLQQLSPEEYERRKKALEAAKANEGARRAQEAKDAKARDAERERLLREKDEREREEREAQIRREREEAESREQEAAEAAARKKAEDEKAAAARADAAARANAPDPTNAPPAEGDERRTSRGAGAPKRNDGPAKKQEPGRGRVSEDRRRAGKLTISRATSGDEGGRQRSMAQMRRKAERQKRQQGGGEPREKVIRDVKVPDAITVQELANRMTERAADLVKVLFKDGMMITVNDTIDAETAELLVAEFGHKVQRVSEADVEQAIVIHDDKDEDMTPRPPVVTIMGHVDHGKTSLLDKIREANVVQGEAGGITQHIGAYQVKTPSGAIVSFLDTPGHAAFTSMRARGAQVTDIVILVVAADDAVMPQTIEAIAHAKAANVPMIVAINKIDKPGVDPNKVRTDLLQHEVVVEGMSGDVQDIEVSALTGQGIPELLEAVALQAEILELKANADRPAEGAVIEAKLDVGRGPVATVLVQRGTLKRGDIFVVGEQWGRVRALVDDHGERIDSAGPSMPVEVLGLQGTPEAGDVLNVVDSEGEAREIADYRARVSREKQAAAGNRASLDQLLAQAQADADVAELPVLVKADVQGSAEAIVQALEKLGNDDVRVRVVHSGVGAITETDIGLAEASNMPVIGFNVRANAPARESANQKGVEIRYYSVIYDLVDDVKAAASGLLKPELRETFIGYATIKEVFKVTGVGKVAGCEVTEGVARRAAGVRLLRDDVVIHQGTLKTLKRFKDEVSEVRAGQECGMAFQNYEDIREGDVIEIFTTEQIERTL